MSAIATFDLFRYKTEYAQFLVGALIGALKGAVRNRRHANFLLLARV